MLQKLYLNTILVFVSLFLVAMLFSACQSPSAYEENIGLNPEGWYYKDTLLFKADIQDIEKPYNVFLNIRHSSEYSKRNLWLKIVTIFPNGKVETAPLNVPMADLDGKWFGTGFGSVLSNQIQIQKNAIFESKGIYEFKIVQDMRYNPVTELIDVGMQIDQIKEEE